jgi:uncharacterized membrane protein
MAAKLTAPLVILSVSIPSIFKMIPRNGMYGFRVRETMASDSVWYPANQVSGIALAIASLVWIAAALGAVPPRYVTITGLSAVAVAVGVSFLYLRFL